MMMNCPEVFPANAIVSFARYLLSSESGRLDGPMSGDERKAKRSRAKRRRQARKRSR
jgi:hypothetical protein